MGRRDTYYDYIRTFAALVVLFCHKGKLPGGSIGVSIFFCLSGFLITQILISLPSLTVSNFAKFIFRRFMRIFPLYVVTLLAAIVLAWMYRPDWLPKLIDGLPGLLTFTHLPNGTGIATAVGWTLHAEFWFYVFFPIVFALTYKRGLLPLTIASLIVVSILAKKYDGGGPDSWPIENDLWRTVLYLDQLMYGAICALLIEKRAASIHLFSSRFWFWGPLITNLLIAKLAPLSHWHLEMSIAALLCAVAILHHEASKQVLKDNLIAWLGRISFSIYLVHAVVIDYLPAQKLPDILDTPSCVIIVLIVAFLTERFVERPGIGLSKAIANYRSDPPRKLPEAVAIGSSEI
jgi:peptidoglycan/LPS O-acetylase OafA/YrhL